MRKIYLKVCCTTMIGIVAIAFAPNRLSSVSRSQQQEPAVAEQRYQQELERKRESFKSGRDLLRKHGVPFDPDLLLEPGFKRKLAPTLAAMREFHESRLVGKQIEGVQLADTLFLPETVELTGDTVIIANQLIFSGKNVVIKGPHDLHFFAMGPIQSVDLAARSGSQSSAFVKAGFSKAFFEELKRRGNLVRPDSITLNIDSSAEMSGYRNRQPMLRTFVTTITRDVPIPRRISISHRGQPEIRDLMGLFQRNLRKQMAARRDFVRAFQTGSREIMGTKPLLREMVEQVFEVPMVTMGEC
jgi:hypothetical protein